MKNRRLLNREELISDIDYLINISEGSGIETVRYDYEIPRGTEWIDVLVTP